MEVQRLVAFSQGNRGGNPAGVVICDRLPDPSVMQAIAAEVGYSETVFAAPDADEWRVRYFAPEIEVDFCGHATIALGAALARQFGAGQFALHLNRAKVVIEGRQSGYDWIASFQSPPTRSRPLEKELLRSVLELFDISERSLDPRIPPAWAHAGADHVVIALVDRDALRAMRYDPERGKDLATRHGIVTFNLLHCESLRVFHARNPFPIGGVYEDPATGAAAAALAGYLRDLKWPHGGSITIHQGADMGIPSTLYANIPEIPGEAIRVSGSARLLTQA